MVDVNVLVDTAMALAPVLVLGGYGYTFLATHNVAKKTDIADIKANQLLLQTRVDDIYKILLEIKKNGNGGK